MDSCNKQINEGNDTTRSGYENPSLCLCINGCGFYGTSATNNLCSKCFKDYCLKKSDAAKPSQDLDNPKKPVFRWARNTTNIANASTDKDAPSGFSSVKNRCLCCKKKVGVMGFSCRCGGSFCGIHRYPEEHGCTFNFKTAGRVALAKEIPVCKADKLDRRI